MILAAPMRVEAADLRIVAEKDADFGVGRFEMDLRGRDGSSDRFLRLGLWPQRRCDDDFRLHAHLRSVGPACCSRSDFE